MGVYNLPSFQTLHFLWIKLCYICRSFHLPLECSFVLLGNCRRRIRINQRVMK